MLRRLSWAFRHAATNLGGNLAGANDRETSTINGVRCGNAGCGGSRPSRRVLPSVRIRPSSGLVSQCSYASRALIKIRMLPALLRYVDGMAQNPFYYRNAVRASDVYFRLNIVGVATGMTVIAWPEERFPGLPRGFTWQWLTGRRTLARWLAVSRRHNWGALFEGGEALRGAGRWAGRVVRRALSSPFPMT